MLNFLKSTAKTFIYIGIALMSCSPAIVLSMVDLMSVILSPLFKREFFSLLKGFWHQLVSLYKNEEKLFSFTALLMLTSLSWTLIVASCLSSLGAPFVGGVLVIVSFFGVAIALFGEAIYMVAKMTERFATSKITSKQQPILEQCTSEIENQSDLKVPPLTTLSKHTSQEVRQARLRMFEAKKINTDNNLSQLPPLSDIPHPEAHFSQLIL